jgi:hypothetical protein
MGSETVVQASRLALYHFLDNLTIKRDNWKYSLGELGNTLSSILNNNLSEDRVSLPLLEVIAYLLDVQLLQRLSETTFK